MAAKFTVDWESYYSAIDPDAEDYEDRVEEPTYFLLGILKKYGVRAIFYALGDTVRKNLHLYLEIKRQGHILGWHGARHIHNLKSSYELFRSPYWDTTPMPFPPSGGFFFRAMPFWYVKWAVKASGTFWIHPHDVDEGHPRLNNQMLNWKRHIGLTTARKKLERLLSEVQFG